MKRVAVAVLFGIWAVGSFLYSPFQAEAEENGTFAGLAKQVQSERDLGAGPSSTLNNMDRSADRIHLDSPDTTLRFETGNRQKATPSDRKADALRYHQNTVLNEFGNADAHGQVALTFSADRLELKLRSITGEEAPIASADHLSKK